MDGHLGGPCLRGPACRARAIEDGRRVRARSAALRAQARALLERAAALAAGTRTAVTEARAASSEEAASAAFRTRMLGASLRQRAVALREAAALLRAEAKAKVLEGLALCDAAAAAAAVAAEPREDIGWVLTRRERMTKAGCRVPPERVRRRRFCAPQNGSRPTVSGRARRGDGEKAGARRPPGVPGQGEP